MKQYNSLSLSTERDNTKLHKGYQMPFCKVIAFEESDVIRTSGDRPDEAPTQWNSGWDGFLY